MVKTIPLVIGAGVLTATIYILYNITQPIGSVVNFFQFNQTHHDRNRVSLSHQNTELSQEFRPETLKPESLAKKMFDKELSRISQNLKAGQTAEFEGEGQPSVVYVNLEGGRGLSENTGFDQNIQNVETNMIVPSRIPDQMIKQNFHIMQLPAIPQINNQNVYQPAHILTAATEKQHQNTVSPNQHQQAQQLKNAQVEQSTPNQNTPSPDDSIQQEWKVINAGAQLPGYQVGPHEVPLPHQAVVQNTQQPMLQMQYNGQSSGVWQTMKPSYSQLSDLVQSVQTIANGRTQCYSKKEPKSLTEVSEPHVMRFGRSSDNKLFRKRGNNSKRGGGSQSRFPQNTGKCILFSIVPG